LNNWATASAPNSSAGCGNERPASLAKALKAHKKALLETPQNIATRKSSESAIEAIAAAMPMEFLAGSADLTGSNNNKAKSAVAFSAKTPKGRFIHYGIREHGMAAAMNGIFLHGGFAPNGATFLVFTDYARPAMAAGGGDGHRRRLCHDPRFDRTTAKTARRTSRSSILAALRAIPNMRVFRPCDAMETTECWELALNRIDGPTVLALTRQNLPQLRPPRRRKSLRPTAPMNWSPPWRGKSVVIRLGFRGRDRGGGPEATGRTRHRVAGGVGALAPNCCWRSRRCVRNRSSATRRSRSRSRPRCAGVGTP